MANAARSIESAIYQNNARKLKAILQGLPRDFDINAASCLAPTLHLFTNSLSPLNLTICIVNRDIELSRLLLQHGADPNTKTEHGGTSLHLAVQTDNDDLVKLLLPLCTNVDEVDEFGRTALHIAVMNENYDVIELLLHNKAAINARDAKGITPLHVSVMSTLNAKMSLHLINLSAYMKSNYCVPENVLQMAARHRENAIEVIDMLVKHGADINARDARDWTVLDLVLARQHEANMKVVLYLLSVDVEFDYMGDRATTLRKMLKNRNIEGLRYIVDLTKKSLDHTPNDDVLYQLMMLFKGNPVCHEIFKLILQESESTACVNPDEPHPLFVSALINADLKLLEMLIEFRLHERCNNHQHLSPMFLAVERDSCEAVRLLISGGVEVNSNLLISALQKSNDDMVKLLLRAGAEINDEDFWTTIVSSWGTIIEQSPATDALVEHVALYPLRSKHCLEIMQSERALANHHQHCCVEVERMKEARICPDVNFTYYDMIKYSRAAVVNLRNEQFKIAWKPKVYEKLFPIYSDELSVCFSEATQRLEKLTKFEDILIDIFIELLPVEVIRVISEFYNDRDFAVCIK